MLGRPMIGLPPAQGDKGDALSPRPHPFCPLIQQTASIFHLHRQPQGGVAGGDAWCFLEESCLGDDFGGLMSGHSPPHSQKSHGLGFIIHGPSTIPGEKKIMTLKELT